MFPKDRLEPDERIDDAHYSISAIISEERAICTKRRDKQRHEVIRPLRRLGNANP
jgi:hypothetical protein